MISPRLYAKDIWFHVVQRRLQRFPVSILMYHSVGHNANFFTVSPGAFRLQMQYLKDAGLSVIPLTAVVEAMRKGEPLPQQSVVLTFDDGYADNFSNAFPILEEMRLPATIFLSTDFIGTTRSVRGVTLEHLSREQIQKMNSSGLIDFQPHGASHRKLAELTLERARFEMESSQRTVESLIGSPRRIFSYPYGSSNASLRALAGELFDAAVGVRRGYVHSGSPVFDLPRQSVDSLVSRRRFLLKI